MKEALRVEERGYNSNSVMYQKIVVGGLSTVTEMCQVQEKMELQMAKKQSMLHPINIRLLPNVPKQGTSENVVNVCRSGILEQRRTQHIESTRTVCIDIL